MKRFILPAIIIVGISIVFLGIVIAFPDVPDQVNDMLFKPKDLLSGNSNNSNQVQEVTLESDRIQVQEVTSESKVPTEEPYGVEIVNGSFETIETPIPDRDHAGTFKTIEFLTLGDTGEKYINQHVFGNLHLYSVDEVIQLLNLAGLSYEIRTTYNDEVPEGLPLDIGGIKVYPFEDKFYYNITGQFFLNISAGPFPDDSFIIGRFENGFSVLLKESEVITKFQAAGYDPKIEYMADDSRPNRSFLSVRVIENGKSLSGDYVFSFKNGVAYVKPGFTGEVTLIFSLTTEEFLKANNSSSLFNLGASVMNGFSPDIDGPEAIRIIRLAGYEPIIEYQKNDRCPDQSVLGISPVKNGIGVIGDTIFLRLGKNCYLKSGFDGKIVISISRISSEYVESTTASTTSSNNLVSDPAYLADNYIPYSTFANVSGKTVDEIVALVQSLGLNISRQDNMYSDTNPVVGTITEVQAMCEIFNGISYVKKGSSVEIRVSLGAYPTDAVSLGAMSSNGCFVEKSAPEIIAILQSYGYTPTINYIANATYSDQTVIGFNVTVAGVQQSGDFVFYRRDGQIYVKPGVTGEIILNVNKLS
jgi:hypothetical protein